MPAQKYYNIMLKFLELSKNRHGFSKITDTCRLVSAAEGKCSVEFEVDERMSNMFGTLHGGVSASMVDIFTTGALVATPKGAPGVSVDLHMTYLASAKVGETVVLDAEVIRAGKSLAFTKADLKLKHTGKLVATGLHTKAFAQHAVAKDDAKQ